MPDKVQGRAMTDAPDVGEVMGRAERLRQCAFDVGYLPQGEDQDAALKDQEIALKAVERAAVRAAVRFAKAQVGLAFEEAATVADPHWPESGHVHQDGDLSCQATISVDIRRMKRGAMESKVLVALAKMEDDDVLPHT